MDHTYDICQHGQGTVCEYVLAYRYEHHTCLVCGAVVALVDRIIVDAERS